jgi:hypothetical protein
VKGGGVEVAVALVAAEAVLVEETVLRWNLLGLKHLALATIDDWACIINLIRFSREKNPKNITQFTTIDDWG